MNYDSDEEKITPIEYVKNNMDIFLENKDIQEILEINHKLEFTSNLRAIIEKIKQRYINLYSGGGIFKNDIYNSNWERLFDIIYDNIEKKYDLGMLLEDPIFFINILENKNIKLE